MKIYTKTGDRGETGLIGGVRVPKHHHAVCVCGDLDETNCCIGITLSLNLPVDIADILTRIQHDLFVLGSQVAECQSESGTGRAVELAADRISWLEQAIDRFDAALPAMTAFILPGGSPEGAQLHLARSVCRRAERSTVRLAASADLQNLLSQVIVYLNRLSDLLFVLARTVNHLGRVPETRWLPRP
jgi:cob(I)alamin adenosyltransferase